MVLYKVYLRNKKGEPELIGTLPERRIDIDRITSDSVDEWLKAVFSDTFDPDDIFIVRETI